MSAGRPAPPTARVADATRTPDLGAVLSRGFQDDPVWQYLVTDDDRRRQHLAAVFAALLRRSAAAGNTWTTAGLEGVAVWAAPDRWRTPWWDIARNVPVLVRGFGATGVGRALSALSTIERDHPEEPHWYLEFVATEPNRRGRGVGGALLRPVLDRCDSEGTCAYLESSKEANLAFYARHGFEVTEQFDIAPDGPPAWRMWRDPH
jgi:GNAT superfamily N-acetyltransferase